MGDREVVIEKIRGAFAGNEHPGGRFLQGSFEGCEPYEEVGPFEKVEDWRSIDAGFLDGHANALSFLDRKSTRLNSSHANISYAVFCLKKKKTNIITTQR